MRIGLVSIRQEKPTGITKCTDALFDQIFKMDRDNQYYALDRLKWPHDRFEQVAYYGDPYHDQSLTFAAEAYNLNIINGNYTAFSLPKGMRCAKIFTIHDIGPFSHPELTGETLTPYFSEAVRGCARECDHITTVSEYTKKEIIEYYGIPEERISVIYWGVSPGLDFKKEGKAIEGLKGINYLLSVSAIHKYKNQVGMIKAFIQFLEHNPDSALCLVITGPVRSGAEVEEFKQTTQYRKWEKHIIFVGYVEDEELVWLYKNALAFLFLSFFEGFGVPVLEAMTVGKAVISSNAASLPEVGGDAVQYCDPYEVESMEEAIEKVVQDESFRKKLEKLGLKRAKEFSYEKAARQMLEVYRKYS